MVIDEGYEGYGVTAEIASVISEGAFYDLDAPVKRLGAMDVPIPFSPVLEDLNGAHRGIGGGVGAGNVRGSLRSTEGARATKSPRSGLAWE